MAGNSKGNKGKLILSLLLILIIVAEVFAYFFFDEKIKSINEKVAEESKEVAAREEVLKEKESELEKANATLDSYENISTKIEELRSEAFKLAKELEDKIIAGESDRKIAYLTFDDGPYYNTYNVLDVLDKYNVKVTFFTTSINGEYCYDNKNEVCFKLYKEYLKHGHTIANHTFTHGIWRGLYSSVDSFMTAVTNQEEQIKNQTDGYVTNILRFPGGSRTAGGLKNGIIEKLREKGYGWVDWTAQDGDGGELNSTSEAWSNFKSSINQDIEVVLFHDYSKITLAILPDAIEYLRSNGYILLPLFYESNMINK